GVVHDPAGDPSDEQGPHSRRKMGEEHHLERRDEEPDDQWNLREGDGPRNTAADIDIETELLREQKTQREQRTDPPHRHRVLERQPRGHTDRGNDAEKHDDASVDPESALVITTTVTTAVAVGVTARVAILVATTAYGRVGSRQSG